MKFLGVLTTVALLVILSGSEVFGKDLIEVSRDDVMGDPIQRSEVKDVTKRAEDENDRSGGFKAILRAKSQQGLMQVSLTAYNASSTRDKNHKKEFALTQVSCNQNGFWHSKGEKEVKPWLVLKMSNSQYDVRRIVVEDRKDGQFGRFENVEVSVSKSANANDKQGKTSCGVESYKCPINTNSNTQYTFNCPAGTKGQYIIIQKLGVGMFHVNHVKVLAANSDCPNGWIRLPSVKSGKCYKASSTKLNYTDAKAQCESLLNGSAKLAEPIDLIETRAIYQATKQTTWIGVNDRQVNNDWRYTKDNSKVVYFNWAPNEPNNNGTQDCVTIGFYQNEKWDDDNCDKKHTYICQISDLGNASGITIGKRSVSDNSDETAMNFVAIDTNADLKIDLDEALARVGAKGTLTSPPDWFTDMDTNKDGFIDTEEFDPGLNDQIILDRQDDDQEE